MNIYLILVIVFALFITNITPFKEIHPVELGMEVAGGESVAGLLCGLAAFFLHGSGYTPPHNSRMILVRN